ncbi:hypothetical protein YB2330_002580 [Saitoella coloradoensis]
MNPAAAAAGYMNHNAMPFMPHAQHAAMEQRVHSFCLPNSVAPTRPDPKSIIWASSNSNDGVLYPAAPDTPPSPNSSGSPPQGQASAVANGNARARAFEQLDHLGALCADINATGSVHASFTIADPRGSALGYLNAASVGQGRGRINVTVTGPHSHTLTARGIFLQQTPIKNQVVVKAEYDLIMDPDASVMKSDVETALEELAVHAGVSIILIQHTTPGTTSTFNGGRAASGSPPLNKAGPNLNFILRGDLESLDYAKVRVQVMLDELAGLKVIRLPIELPMQPLIAGRKRMHAATIERESGTQVYFPTPFASVFGYRNPQSGPRNPHEVLITGEFAHVFQAREMLQVKERSIQLYTKDIIMIPEKIDWLLLEKLSEVRNIMQQNATFIAIPTLGSHQSLLRIHGTSLVLIERTIRSLNALICAFYTAQVWVLPLEGHVGHGGGHIHHQPHHGHHGHGHGQDDDDEEKEPIMQTLQQNVSEISGTSGAELSFRNNCFEVHGAEEAVRAAVMMINNLGWVQKRQVQCRIRLELSNEHREFISGKKNGKINKVMKEAHVHIKFEPFTEYNFIIDLISQGVQRALDGLTMLQAELPAEISFFVPEAYHKRIIGVGGKNIQRIMKQYGVYVKFSNALEFAALGGYFDNDDNVVARTPSKNAVALEELKASIMELVSSRDKDYITETINIPRGLHRMLNHEYRIKVLDISEKTNCGIKFPDERSGSDIVQITGPESQVPLCIQMLLELVPEEYQLRVPQSQSLQEVVTQPQFRSQVVDTMRRNFNIDCIVHPSPDRVKSSAGPGSSGSTGNFHTFILRYSRGTSEHLGDAIQLVHHYLMAHNIQVFGQPVQQSPTNDSFSDSLQYFNSKLLPLGTGVQNGTPGW